MKKKHIKDIRNLFRLIKKLNYTAIKDMINLVRLEQEIKAIKDFKNDQAEDKYHKPIRVSNF